MNRSNKEHQLEAKIFSDYRTGRNIQDIAIRNKVSQTKVKSLIYNWRSEMEDSRKEISRENELIKPLFMRQSRKDFILCTDNEAVLTAYCKMVYGGSQTKKKVA